MKLLKTKLVIILAFILWASSAQAACNLSGYPIRVTSVTGETYLFFRTFHLANFYFLGVARDPFVAATINKSATGKTKVFVQSGIAECPVPAPGANWIGVINKIILGV